MASKLFCLFFVFSSLISFSQSEKNFRTEWPDTSLSNKFIDTSSLFVCDSFSMNLGHFTENLAPSYSKKVKYIGSDTLYVTKAWTNDPHFICRYPKGKIIPGKIYSLRFCFFFKARRGRFRKGMGLKLSNGESLDFYFSGVQEAPQNQKK